MLAGARDEWGTRKEDFCTPIDYCVIMVFRQLQVHHNERDICMCCPYRPRADSVVSWAQNSDSRIALFVRAELRGNKCSHDVDGLFNDQIVDCHQKIESVQKSSFLVPHSSNCLAGRDEWGTRKEDFCTVLRLLRNHGISIVQSPSQQTRHSHKLSVQT